MCAAAWVARSGQGRCSLGRRLCLLGTAARRRRRRGSCCVRCRVGSPSVCSSYGCGMGSSSASNVPRRSPGTSRWSRVERTLRLHLFAHNHASRSAMGAARRAATPSTPTRRSTACAVPTWSTTTMPSCHASRWQRGRRTCCSNHAQAPTAEGSWKPLPRCHLLPAAGVAHGPKQALQTSQRWARA